MWTSSAVPNIAASFSQRKCWERGRDKEGEERGRERKREQERSWSLFYNLISEDIYHHHCHMLLVTQDNCSTIWERMAQVCEYQRQGSSGTILELAISLPSGPQWFMFFSCTINTQSLPRPRRGSSEIAH